MVESILIASLPLVADEGRHQKKEGALGLVEVGDYASDHVIVVAGGNHQLSVAIEEVCVVMVHPKEYVAECGMRVDMQFFELIGVPLENMHLLKV